MSRTNSSIHSSFHKRQGTSLLGPVVTGPIEPFQPPCPPCPRARASDVVYGFSWSLVQSVGKTSASSVRSVKAIYWVGGKDLHGLPCPAPVRCGENGLRVRDIHIWLVTRLRFLPIFCVSLNCWYIVLHFYNAVADMYFEANPPPAGVRVEQQPLTRPRGDGLAMPRVASNTSTFFLVIILTCPLKHLSPCEVPTFLLLKPSHLPSHL